MSTYVRIALFFSHLIRFSRGVYGFILCAFAMLPAMGQARDIEPVPESLVYCTVCHGVMLSGNNSTGAPGLAGLPAWFIENQLTAFSKGWRGTHSDDISGSEMYPVAVELEHSKFEVIAEMVSNLPRTPQREITLSKTDLERGKSTYQACTACHGATAEGNKSLNAPPLNIQGAWYIKKQLRNFKEGIRGYHSDDTYGKTMASSAALFKEDDIDALADYITTLK